MPALMPWTPWKKEMERFFDRVFEEMEFPELPKFVMRGEWAPALDLVETKDALVVKAEIPSMEPKDIQLTLQDQVLTLKGEKKEEKEEKDEHYYRAERTYGAFARTLRLPVPVDGSKVTATFKHGLLTITLPKAPAAKGTPIAIKAE
jgi:HSP20 family protein